MAVCGAGGNLLLLEEGERHDALRVIVSYAVDSAWHLSPLELARLKRAEDELDAGVIERHRHVEPRVKREAVQYGRHAVMQPALLKEGDQGAGSEKRRAYSQVKRRAYGQVVGSLIHCILY